MVEPDLQEIPTAEPTIEELELEEILVEPEMEKITSDEQLEDISTIEPTTDGLKVEEILVEPDS